MVLGIGWKGEAALKVSAGAHLCLSRCNACWMGYYWVALRALMCSKRKMIGYHLGLHPFSFPLRIRLHKVGSTHTLRQRPSSQIQQPHHASHSPTPYRLCFQERSNGHRSRNSTIPMHHHQDFPPLPHHPILQYSHDTLLIVRKTHSQPLSYIGRKFRHNRNIAM